MIALAIGVVLAATSIASVYYAIASQNSLALAQAERDNAPGGLGGGGDIGGGSGSAAGQPQTMPSSGAGGPQPTGVPVGASPSASPPPGETFPPPEDIPSGRDDDVVARQLREAAMREPDPELREALWDEYRKYTGISEQE